MADIPTQLRRARQRAGLSLRQLAELLGGSATVQQLSTWELGKHQPRAAAYQRWLAACDRAGKRKGKK